MIETTWEYTAEEKELMLLKKRVRISKFLIIFSLLCTIWSFAYAIATSLTSLGIEAELIFANCSLGYLIAAFVIWVIGYVYVSLWPIIDDIKATRAQFIAKNK